MRKVAEVKKYGKINIKLKEQMDDQKISIYKMSKYTDLKYNTIKDYYNNKALARYDSDVLAKICYTLQCDIADILEYTEEKES